MKIYISKENIHDIIIPSMGKIDLRNGGFYEGVWSNFSESNLEEDTNYWSMEVPDELINNLIETSKEAKEIIHMHSAMVYNASEMVRARVLREHGKRNEARWGGIYSLMDITLDKDDPSWSYDKLMHRGLHARFSNVHTEIEDVCSADIYIKIYAHIGYVLSDGLEKEKSIVALKQFVQDYKDKNPNLEEIIFSKVLKQT